MGKHGEIWCIEVNWNLAVDFKMSRTETLGNNPHGRCFHFTFAFTLSKDCRMRPLDSNMGAKKVAVLFFSGNLIMQFMMWMD